jgi:hypothetical protein
MSLFDNSEVSLFLTRLMIEAERFLLGASYLGRAVGEFAAVS